MSPAEYDAVSEVMNRVRTWPQAQRMALARRILESLEGRSVPERPRTGSLKNLVGLLKIDSPAPSDEECLKILEGGRIKKHLWTDGDGCR